ncbi:hypothetical protein ACFQ3W_02025 [Paenibacillus puldeungensis]|uniref:Aspartyl-phosphate phosphatase Spo0E family protein n=1 Tax=Paenibacillus puldeungensis TaxID=696536 RepID=A0ABW3RRK7_9BACL
MTHDTAALNRRSEMLKIRIGKMIARENQYGLGDQESHLLQRFIRELHQTEHERKSSHQ